MTVPVSPLPLAGEHQRGVTRVRGAGRVIGGPANLLAWDSQPQGRGSPRIPRHRPGEASRECHDLPRLVKEPIQRGAGDPGGP